MPCNRGKAALCLSGDDSERELPGGPRRNQAPVAARRGAATCFELRRATDASEGSLLRAPARRTFLHRIAIPLGNHGVEPNMRFPSLWIDA
jgi:hypothetical protein